MKWNTLYPKRYKEKNSLRENDGFIYFKEHVLNLKHSHVKTAFIVIYICLHLGDHLVNPISLVIYLTEKYYQLCHWFSNINADICPRAKTDLSSVAGLHRSLKVVIFFGSCFIQPKFGENIMNSRIFFVLSG